MTMRQPWSRRAASLLMAVTLVGCGGPGVPAGSSASGASGEQPPSGAASDGLAAVPSAPAIDLVDPAGSMIAAEISLRAEDRERAGLVNLGPGALDLAAAMDAAAARVLADLRGGTGTGRLDGQMAVLGGNPPVGRTPPQVAQPGFNSMLVWATLINTLGDFAREPKSVTVEMPPETVEIAGNTGTITTTMTINAVVTGSRLSVDLSLKSKGQVVDRSSGQVLFSIDSIATGHIDVDFCPDAGGRSPANVKLTSSEVYVQGGGGAKGISKEFVGNVVITVGDDAKISQIDGAAQATEDSKGGVPPAGTSDADLAVSTRRASDNIATDGTGQRRSDVPRNIQIGGDGTTADEQIRLWGSMSLFVETMVTAAAREAEKLWREGKCVELEVDPATRDVEPDETLTVTAKLKHTFEGTELDKPVEAILSGVKSIDPANELQPAPATLTYTAGSEDGDFGRIDFKSVSNRGIAQKTVTYTVRPRGWSTNADTPLGRIRGSKCDGYGGAWIVKGVEDLGAGKITTVWTITIDETTSAGTYRHKKVQDLGPSLTTSDQSGKARIVRNDDGSVMMTLDAAPLTITTKNSFGGAGTVTVDGDGRRFLWARATTGDCP